MRLFLFFIAASGFFSSVAQPYKKELKQLDAYFAQALNDWNVPGMAVAIVKDGETIFAKGYGVKSVDTNEPVDANTAFAIASNTKAVTAAALAVLVDEGKLKWDDKVQQYLPWFQLYDPYVSANLTVRDLLCHRSGLETFSGDLIWYGSTYSRREILERARFLKPKYGFREHFGYQNILFLAAGEIVSEVSGMPWDDFVTERFIRPLNQTNTHLSVNGLLRGVNAASPHNEKNGKNEVIDWVNWDNIGPAGSIITSVNDWTAWLKLQLGEGTLDGRTFWDSTRTREMWTLHTPQAISKGRQEIYPTMTFKGYGLGWELFAHHGRKVVAHGGGYDGFISRSAMVPEEGLGMIVVTNSNSSLSYAMSYRILDVLLGVKDPTDWSARFLELTKGGEEADDPNKVNGIDRVAETTPSHDLKTFAGTYRDKMYGDIEVRLVGDQLVFQFAPTPLFRGTLRHYHYDTFQIVWGTRMMLPTGLARFALGNDGLPEELHVDVPNPDFDFTELIFRKLD